MKKMNKLPALATGAEKREAGQMRKTTQMMMFAALAASLAFACQSGDDPDVEGTGSQDTDTDTGSDQKEPDIGQSDFVSADGSAGQESGGKNGDDAVGGDYEQDDAPTEAEGEGESERSVEEGDIYRVLEGSKILNLNAYRGLQVIDFADVSNPRIIGRLPITGSPVEMYVVGDYAYVLLNNWRSYYGSRTDVDVESYEGGVVIAADISDPKNPKITDRATIPGYIQTSRLTRGGGKSALFAVSSVYDQQSTTVVRSFAMDANGGISEKTTLDLGGYVQDIQATTEALLVARYDWNWSDNTSTVTIVDISDPDGVMVEGAEVTAAGRVNKKTDMNLYKGILRIASSAGWSGSDENHLQTWNVADIQNPVPVDHETFGEGEQLYATLFLGNKAFFVTYFRTDPFHAFEITDEGDATEKAEFIISGWNDWFKPVFDETRLIGIGQNDELGNTMAVSLYDISNLENPAPFIARAEVDAHNSWSEASWDDRAFSVLQNAVSVEAQGGIVETGMVLLPFQGYDEDYKGYIAGVQIFTFSESTLTRRGLMLHGTSVRRSFLANDDVTANLSEAELSLFDHTDPAAPKELGRVELAPNYADFLVYGDYGARFKWDRDYWWWGDVATMPDNELQVVPLSKDPDSADKIAAVKISAGATVMKVEDLAVTMETKYDYSNYDEEEGYKHTTTLEVVDMGDPTAPKKVGTLVSSELQSGYYGGGYWEEDCWDCGGYYYRGNSAQAVGRAVVFPQYVRQEKLLGIEHYCDTYPTNYGYGCDEEVAEPSDGGPDEGGDTADKEREPCKWYSGGIRCSHLEGEEELCTGTIRECGYDKDGQYSCVEVDPDSIETETHCGQNERRRYWSSYEFQVVDLSTPSEPVLRDAIAMPETEEAADILAVGDTLYVSYRVPVDVDGDPRPYVKYYFKTIDLSDPASPKVSAGVNVPGIVIAAEGASVYTRDLVWGDDVVETAVNRLEVKDGKAVLKARKRFNDREVSALLLDNKGKAYVTHRLAWYVAYDDGYDWNDIKDTLAILDLSGDGMTELGEIEIDNWATLRDVKKDRALFSVPGGLLVINVANAGSPYAQSYYPINGWPENVVVEGDDIIVPAGRYGIYKFDINYMNLPIQLEL